MNIKDILNLDIGDISKLNRQELAKTVSILGSAANKRLKRFSNKEIETPATRAVARSGGKISVADKNINELRAEFVRAKTFLTAKTSTYKGFTNVQKQFEKRIGGILTPAETKEFWSAYNKLSELEPQFLKVYGSDRMQQFLHDEIIKSNNDSDSLVKNAKFELDKAYEKIEEEYAEKEDGINGVSDFFELGDEDI